MTSLQCATTVIIARAGHADGGSLTPPGRGQAAALGESLAGRRVAHVWTSSSSPATQTAEIAAAAVGVRVTERVGLRESGRGESDQELVDRVREVLQEVADAHPGETALVVSHGKLIELGVPALARLDVEPRHLDHCDTVELDIDADDWVCRSWGKGG